MVGQPYQIHIPVLALGEEVEVEVGLQRPEVEDLTVQLQYLNRTDDHIIHLEKASARDVVRVYATQFSQEGPLGNSVAYELQLERLAEDEKIFQLMAHGLPDDFRYEFESGGRNLSRLRFSRDHSSDSLTLNVYVPEQDESFTVDQPFAVLSAGLRAKCCRCRGVGRSRSRALASHGHRLRATATSAYGPGRIGTDHPSTSTCRWMAKASPSPFWQLRNLGTVELLDIRLQALSPPGWNVAFEPQEIALLPPREEIEAVLTVRPINSAEIGRYEVKTSASTQHKGQWVESVERTVNINIKSNGSFWGITGLVILLVSIVLGIAVFTVQWSKR